MFLGKEEFTPGILFDVIMFNVRMRTEREREKNKLYVLKQ
jgi:hypothetical protein